MIDHVINSIGIALNSCFGNDFKIYSEPVEQGLQEPCFFIQCVNSSFTRQLGDQFFYENLFCIQFFPKNKLNPKSECLPTAEKLLLCLEYIYPDSQPIRGKNMNFQIIDGILNFFVNFNLVMIKTQNTNPPKMNNLEKIKFEVIKNG